MKKLKCKVCERKTNDLRYDVCYDCAECESVINDNTTMFDKKIKKEKSFEKYSISISQLRFILKTYGIIK